MSSKTPDSIDRHVGGRVRMRRMVQGLSQEKLGERLGLTFQQIQKYEKGVNRIGAGRLFQIAQILEVPVGYFFDGLPNGEGAQDVSADGVTTSFDLELLSSTEAVQLNAAYFRIEDIKIRKKILDLVKEMSTPGKY